MMYIDPSKLSVDAKWLTRAKVALTALENSNTKEQRSKLLNDNAGIWRIARRELRKLSYGKCWYSEAPQSGASQDVDHYRPKGRVDECSSHEGYWWLAFEPKNFRLSSQFCNQFRNNEEDGTGGKLDHFPLVNESDRATYSTRAILKRELPILLDPCSKSDASLIWIEEDGFPRPTVKPGNINHTRAQKSIEIYNLRSDSFVKGRRNQVQVARVALEQAKRAFDKIEELLDGTWLDEFENSITILETLLHPSQPYTLAVRCLLKANRSEAQPWIDDLV